MDIDKLTDEEIAAMEAERAARVDGYNKIKGVKHHGTVEDLNASEIDSMEAERAARVDGYNKIKGVKHHGTVEDLNASEIDSMEAEIKARRNEKREIEQHYGSIENADSSTINAMEYMRSEQIKQDDPHKEYLNSLLENPDITDQVQFEAAVLRSMQSNGVMRKFVDGLFEKLQIKTFKLKNTDKNDRESVENIQQEIQNLIAVYQKYMYTLKENQWEFHNLNEMKVPEEIKEDLWQQQKRHGIEFKMPIPADMGEYYGGKYERVCKMVPGLETMYQDLSGKQVNWHQVMIYRDDELTPQQRYRQRLQEQIKQKQETLTEKEAELKTLEERQQGGQTYGE